MKNIKHHFPLLLIFISQFLIAQTATDGLYFDGVNDNITVPNTSNINSTTTNNRTYETSFKVVNASSTTKQIIMKEGGGTRAVIIYVQSGFLYLGAYNRTDYTPTWQGTFYREAISSDTWYHLALVFDNALPGNATTNPMNATANNALKWYLDGNLMGQVSGYQLGAHNSIRLGYKNESLRFPSCGSWTATGASEYCFGTIANDNGGNEYYFNGYIWGFRVWNDVRTSTEINDYKTDIITTVGTDGLVAALDGDTFTYLNNSNNPTEAAVTTVPTVVWSATASSTDWNTATNWVGNVIPNASTKQGVRIQPSSGFYPEIGTHIITGDLEVEPGANITVNASGTLEISYDLTNDGTITVVNEGSLILREKVASTSIGTFNIQRETPSYSNNDFYSYWSSPVVPGDSKIATVFPDAELIYKFNASATSSDWALNGTADFETGVGYAIQNEGLGGQLRTFSGNINKGDIAVNIYNTSNTVPTGYNWSDEGDNLVGNPYASAIDWNLVINDPDNDKIEGEFYRWNQQTRNVGENNVAEYIECNGSGCVDATKSNIISSGQGFFIKTISSDPNLKITFKTTHQVAGANNNFYRSASTIKNTEKKKGRSWFTFNHNNKTNTLLVGFLDKATNRFDRLYDAPFDINQTSMGFYSLVKGINKASIQGLPVLKRDKKVVKLGYIVDEIGDYSIGIQEEQIDEDYYIYLRDREKKITVDLRQRSYEFTIDSIGENNTRFKVIYTKKKRKATQKTSGKESYTVDEIDSKDFTVYVDNRKELIVEYDFDVDNIKDVSLFNLQGRKVAAFSGAQTKNISNLSIGVYIINATLHDNRVLNKKIVIAN